MYLKEQFNLKIPEGQVHKLYQIGAALDKTFVVDAQFIKTTRKIIHQAVDGKQLLQLHNGITGQTGAYHPFRMMSDREVMVCLQNYKEIEIRVVNLQSKHVSKSLFSVKTYEQKLQKYMHWHLRQVYLFPQTQLVSIVLQDYNLSSMRVLYFKYDQFQEGNAMPLKQYFFQGSFLDLQKVNDYSKLAVWKLHGLTLEFLTFINQKEELATLRNHQCNWLTLNQDNNVVKVEYYYQMQLIQCRPDFYFLKIHQHRRIGSNTIKYGFLDTTVKVPMFKEILISVKELMKNGALIYPLKDTILFYRLLRSSPTYSFYYEQQAMVEDHQQAGGKCSQELFFFPNWERNTFVRIQDYSKIGNEMRVTVKTFVPWKDASMHMLLHLNEDFDDDLLMDCIEMLYEYD